MVVGGPEVEDGGGAATQQFGDSQLRRGLDSVAVEGGFERPGAQAKPVEKLELIGLVAEERLHHVDMALNKAGEHCGATGVEDPRRPFLPDVRALGQGFDAAVANQDVAAEPLALTGHRDHETVLDQEVSHGLPSPGKRGRTGSSRGRRWSMIVSHQRSRPSISRRRGRRARAVIMPSSNTSICS